MSEIRVFVMPIELSTKKDYKPTDAKWHLFAARAVTKKLTAFKFWDLKETIL